MDRILDFNIYEKNNGCIYILLPCRFRTKPVDLYIEHHNNYDGFILEVEDYEDHKNLGFFKTQEAAIKYFQEYINNPNYCYYRYNSINGFNFEDKEIE